MPLDAAIAAPQAQPYPEERAHASPMSVACPLYGTLELAVCADRQRARDAAGDGRTIPRYTRCGGRLPQSLSPCATGRLVALRGPIVVQPSPELAAAVVALDAAPIRVVAVEPAPAEPAPAPITRRVKLPAPLSIPRRRVTRARFSPTVERVARDVIADVLRRFEGNR